MTSALCRSRVRTNETCLSSLCASRRRYGGDQNGSLHESAASWNYCTRGAATPQPPIEAFAGMAEREPPYKIVAPQLTFSPAGLS